jgi:hypothetical protein
MLLVVKLATWALEKPPNCSVVRTRIVALSKVLRANDTDDMASQVAKSASIVDYAMPLSRKAIRTS